MLDKNIIGIDVDSTIVDTLNPWFQWMEKVLGKEKYKKLRDEFEASDELYALDGIMEKFFKDTNKNPMDFWRQKDLYDNLKPFDDALEYIEKLHKDTGSEILFISKMAPEHAESKIKFLRKYFPYYFDIMNGRRKFLIYMDYFIDDHLKYISEMRKYRPEVFCFAIETPLNRVVKENIKFWKWDEIYNTIKEDTQGGVVYDRKVS